MDPSDRSPLLQQRSSVKALCRFRDVLTSQLTSLQDVLDAAFEQELDLATSRVTESERVCRIAAEVEVKRLESELQELREEVLSNTPPSPGMTTPAPLPVKAPAPSAVAALSPLLAWESEPIVEPLEIQILEGAAEERPHALSECRSTVFLETLQALSPTSAPAAAPPLAIPVGSSMQHSNSRGVAHTRNNMNTAANSPICSTPTTKNAISRVPSEKGLKSSSKAEDGRKTPKPQRQSPTPSRIPKPSSASTPSRVQKSLGESLTLEDLDDERLLKLTTHRHTNGSPLQSRSTGERSATPQSGRWGGRAKGSRDDSMTTAKREEARARSMLDKRTLRRMHRDAFRAAIKDWTEHRAAPPSRAKKNPACQVFVRMRPIFEKELQNGEFESVSVVEES